MLFLEHFASLLHCTESGHRVTNVLSHKNSRLHVEYLLGPLRKLGLVRASVSTSTAYAHGILRHPTGEPSVGAGETKTEVTRSIAKLIHLLIVADGLAIELLILGPSPCGSILEC